MIQECTCIIICLDWGLFFGVWVLRLVRALKVEAYLDWIEISACGLSLRLEELSAVVRWLTDLHKVLLRKWKYWVVTYGLVIYCRLGELPLSQLAVESYPSAGAGPGGEYKFCIILVLNMILKLVIFAWVHCWCESHASLLCLVDAALDLLALVDVRWYAGTASAPAGCGWECPHYWETTYDWRW